MHAAGEESDRLYLVMRLVPGTDLRAAVDREGQLDPLRAARIVTEVASALDAATPRDSCTAT